MAFRNGIRSKKPRIVGKPRAVLCLGFSAKTTNSDDLTGVLEPERLHSAGLVNLHLGKALQPKNCDPAFDPDFTVLKTNALAHFGQVEVLSCLSFSEARCAALVSKDFTIPLGILPV